MHVEDSAEHSVRFRFQDKCATGRMSYITSNPCESSQAQPQVASRGILVDPALKTKLAGLTEKWFENLWYACKYHMKFKDLDPNKPVNPFSAARNYREAQTKTMSI